MREVTTKVYTFNELSTAAQQKAIDKISNSDYIYDQWWDYIYDNFKSDAAEFGVDIDANEITFNLDRGSFFGVDAEGVTINDEFVKKTLKLKNMPYIDIKFNVAKVGLQHIEFPRDRWHHSKDNDSGWYELIMENVSSKMKPKVKELVAGMMDKLSDLCAKSYEDLRAEYDHMLSDEYIRDMIEANDYEFEEDGTRI